MTEEWTKESALAALEAHRAKHPVRPPYKGWRAIPHKLPSIKALEDLFGTFTIAMDEAGYAGRPPRRRRVVPTITASAEWRTGVGCTVHAICDGCGEEWSVTDLVAVPSLVLLHTCTTAIVRVTAGRDGAGRVYAASEWMGYVGELEEA